MPETFAEVILPLPLPERYTYRVPEHLADRLRTGVRVLVPFGGRKIYSAIVTGINHIPPVGVRLKELHSLLDETPVIYPVNLELWQWMADYYLATPGEVLNAALPAALKPEGRDGTVEERYHEKTRTMIALAPAMVLPENQEKAISALTKAPKQKMLIEFLLNRHYQSGEKTIEPFAKEILLKESGTSDAVLMELVRKEYLISYREQISRLGSEFPEKQEVNPLNFWQKEALDNIKSLFLGKQTVLLHGITASGKTEIYIHLMLEACQAGKQVLYLIPEISLTPQIINRLYRVFGRKTGVYHSKMSDAERVEVWNNVLRFDPDTGTGYQIILGARSAVFLPFRKLGLIIVDEEHENSFKQHDPAPRYNARDMAVVMGLQHRAPVLLGSATPSFESYFNAISGKYGLVKLLQRHGQAAEPEILIADLQKAYKRRQMISMLTPVLHKEIKSILEQGRQAVLFQNRRGYSPFLECMHCGWIPVCENCDVSLTYHKQSGILSCHYCGFHTRPPLNCPACTSENIKKRGLGTEKIEDEIIRLFPQARVARMDLDATRSKRAFERIIRLMETGKIDILAGTQMVTKGLDMEHVGLAAVINADNLLNFPDFRAHERAFQMMLQVSGRSGRKDHRGRVVIQTSQPDHPVIRYVVKNDYEGFFREHAEERKLFFYPPFYKMIRISLKHKDKNTLDGAAGLLAHSLFRAPGIRILGPEYPLISRIQQLFIKEIWIKYPKGGPADEIKKSVVTAVKTARELPGLSNIVIQVDVDPV